MAPRNATVLQPRPIRQSAPPAWPPAPNTVSLKRRNAHGHLHFSTRTSSTSGNAETNDTSSAPGNSSHTLPSGKNAAVGLAKSFLGKLTSTVRPVSQRIDPGKVAFPAFATSSDVKATRGAAASPPRRSLPENEKLRNVATRLKDYEGEETGKVFGSKVKYLDQQQREKYRVTVQDGLLIDSKGNPLDTRDGPTGGPLSFLAGRGLAIFVMDQDGNLYVKKQPTGGKFHHTSFLAGEPVAAAGEVTVRKGKLVEINRISGHYKPSLDQLGQAVGQLERQGVSGFSIYKGTEAKFS